MYEDAKVQDRLRAVWDEIPTSDPDIGRIRRKGSRRRVGRVIGVTVAGAFVVGALVVPLWALSGISGSKTSPGAGEATPPHTVQDSQEWITVDAREAVSHPQAVISELRGAGIDASIVEVPVDSEDVRAGRWNQVTFEQANAISEADFEALSEDGKLGGNRLRLPSPIAGPVSLFVNRTVRGNEVAWFFGTSHRTNELSPTGMFWCLALEAMTPSEATSVLQDLGYRVSWLHVDAALGMYRVDVIPEDEELVFSFLSGPGSADLRFADAADAEHAREAFGTPSTKYPRSTWSDWATCG